ncbi:glycoside hydrolase [Neptunitalea chrysea]|uniref:Glycoside hydrolase n=1 Tax=Neptunitalea chrysea TaxID=1647581 RepID=A0A9W6B3S0_9FLAO|nr:glycosyltransferase family 4 protein [Neptunitalea chrysea]GLB52053.1 glycoside hydrolase [Neptunitalea chrysea]
MTKLTHVGYIVSHYPHEVFGHDGGLGTSVFNLVEMLSQKIKVSVFVYGQEKNFEIKEGNHTIYSIKNTTKKPGFYFNRKHIESFINRKIKEEAIQLIEAPDWTGITAFMKFPIPLVIRFHGSDTYFCHIEGRKQKWKNKFFERVAVSGADAFIAPTAYAGKVSKELFKVTKQVETIHYGLKLENFDNDEPESFTEGLIFYIGTLIRKKGVLELPHIFKNVLNRCPNAQLVLAGSDAPDIETGASSTWELIQDMMDESLSKQVTYMGKIPYSKVREMVQKAHVCVFPTYAETLGMVTIESMAMQKPVVNSNIGWAQELMEDGKSGFLVHPSNHEFYSQRIISLLSDKELSLNIGKEGRVYVEEKFDIRKQAEKNIEFYTQLLS